MLHTLPVTHALQIRAYLGVPIVLPDGELYGTLCCYRTSPDHRLGDRDADELRLLAGVIAQRIAEEERSAYSCARRPSACARSSTPTSPTWCLQPIVSLLDGRVVGHEALARFVRPRPAGLGAGPVVRARATAGARRRAGGQGRPQRDRAVAAAGPRHLPVDQRERERALQRRVHEKSWKGRWRQVRQTSPVALVLELTEHELLADRDLLTEQVARWRDLGLRLAMGRRRRGLRRARARRPPLAGDPEARPVAREGGRRRARPAGDGRRHRLVRARRPARPSSPRGSRRRTSSSPCGSSASTTVRGSCSVTPRRDPVLRPPPSAIA